MKAEIDPRINLEKLTNALKTINVRVRSKADGMIYIVLNEVPPLRPVPPPEAA